MHDQITIAPGVYITDFRKNATLTGIDKNKNPLTNDVGLLLDMCHSNQSKCSMLEYSIREIKEEEKWQDDPDFVEAIEDNWKVIVRLSQEMKEAILKLTSLNYKPQNEKMEELLDIARIESREKIAQEQVDRIMSKREEKVEAEVAEEEEESKKPANKAETEEKGQDEGVYL